MSKKIAFPTDDGETISRHFGSAHYFRVIDLDNGQAEMREKEGHHSHDHEHEHHHHEPGHEHGHGGKFALLHDCATLIGAGMGQPAYNRVQQMGLEIILTGEKLITTALEKYVAGTLSSDMRRVHAHHHHDDDHGNGRQSIEFHE
ncbi:MAG: hypothetical protein KC443_02020 [Anaerolineales bacterium]|nr:hypothetical protein [Anaerolineales bacterium]